MVSHPRAVTALILAAVRPRSVSWMAVEPCL